MAAFTGRSLEYWLYSYRRTWRGTVVSSVLTPLLYLTAMGVGLGALVDRGGTARLHGVSYLAFIAPGLLAATAMQVATFESTYPVMGAIKWQRTYHAMLATPLGVRDVVAGHLWWVAFRIGSTCVVYLGVMSAFGVVSSPWAVLALPAALLTGMAFAAPIMAFAASQERDSGFNGIFRFGLIPMFLFSGTFFPVSQLPALVRPLAYVTPLWHGVDLCRELVLGTVTTSGGVNRPLIHLAYLGVWAVGGVLLARLSFRRRLVV
ncbi:MAG TPA: ABC transporter permease [Mycobacteriales bacterium]|nr:ABC transporter permease [Mycobacteriales bacterium]